MNSDHARERKIDPRRPERPAAGKRPDDRHEDDEAGRDGGVERERLRGAPRASRPSGRAGRARSKLARDEPAKSAAERPEQVHAREQCNDAGREHAASDSASMSACHEPISALDQRYQSGS